MKLPKTLTLLATIGFIGLSVWVIIIVAPFFYAMGSSIANTVTYFSCGKVSIKKSDLYYRGCNKVYLYRSGSLGFKYEEVIGADAETFEQIKGTAYGRDKRAVYYEDAEIKGSDIRTFVVLTHQFSKDKNNIYHTTETLDLHVSEVTFDKDLDYLKDTKNVYYLGTRIVEADAATFKDNVPCVDAVDKNHAYAGTTILKDIDPNTLEYLFDNFCRDKNYLIFTPEDPNYKTRIIPHVDPATFIKVGESGEQFFYKDNANVYSVDPRLGEFTELQKADSKTFQILQYGFAADVQNVYLKGKILPEIDRNTFIFITEHYSKDKNNIYFLDPAGFRVIKDVDIPSFVLLDYPLAKDVRHVFYFEKKLEGANPATFRKYPNLKKKDSIANEDIYGDGEYFYAYGDLVDKQYLIEK